MIGHNSKHFPEANGRSFAEHIDRMNESGFHLVRLETLAHAVRDRRLPHGARLVLLSIIERMSRITGTAIATRKDIATELAVSEQTVSNYLHQLRQLGYIASEWRDTDDRKVAKAQHHTLTKLSPEDLEDAITRAVKSIRGEISTVVAADSYSPASNSLAETVTRGQVTSLPVSKTNVVQEPVAAETPTCPQVSYSPVSKEEIPAGSEVTHGRVTAEAGAYRERARGSKNSTSNNKRRARGEGVVGGEEAAVTARRGTRLPEDWFLPKAWGEWSLTNFQVSVDQVRAEAERFKNHWLSKAGKEAIKLDWYRTWQNWCASDIKAWRRRSSMPVLHGGHLIPVDDSEASDPKADAEIRALRALSSEGRR